METLFEDLAKHVEVDPKIVLISMVTAAACSYAFAAPSTSPSDSRWRPATK
jgi:hypothetical protein